VHLIVEDVRSLDSAEVAEDLGQSAADIVFLSFSDSDLAAFASAYRARPLGGPSLRLANLNRLKHPYSVDLYVDKVVSQARLVVVRLLGGLDYWRYGVDELASLARARGQKLAIVPGDFREDPRLDVASTLPIADLRRIWDWFQAGGPDNMASFAGYAAGAAGEVGASWREPVAVGASGAFEPASRGPALGLKAGGDKPLALVLLYRSIVASADTAPFLMLADALATRGLNVATRFVTSLKDPAVVAELGAWIDAARPDVIVNTTAFSARLDDGGCVLDRADCVVLQAMLATSSREAWGSSARGLSATDLAMNVVLPELDGRVITTAISFKAPAEIDPAFEFARLEHAPEQSRISHVADLAANWARLRAKSPATRTLALVLSNYPAKLGRTGYAVGLDTGASVGVIVGALCAAGYAIGEVPTDVIGVLEGIREFGICGSPLSLSRSHKGRGDAGIEGAGMSSPLPLWKRGGQELRTILPLTAYRALFATLPQTLQADILAAHGGPTAEFVLPIIHAGNLVIALQPDRGSAETRKSDAHDMSRPPSHAYVAFYLYLRHVARIDALIHLGTHGTLEWLPGKAVALDEGSAPEAILGPTPVLYPFIVNNPGEAAQAKRRIAAVTIGHMTPPLVEAGLSGDVAAIEALLDEYMQAQSLDPRRAKRLSAAILEKAADTGLADEIGIEANDDPAEALQSLDARLCDIKEMRVGDGLHVFGCAPAGPRLDAMAAYLSDISSEPAAVVATRFQASAAREIAGLLAGLDGRFVPPGPAGAPSRGRLDVLPTGRNLTSIDPRGVPTPTAWEMAKRAASDLMTRHAQDHGDWPKRLVVDLWASSSMRTGGENLAEALALLGVRPEWEPSTARVIGFRILNPATLDFPRVDVTLRISGLFRDVFPAAITLFDEAVEAVAGLDEDDDINPLAASRRARGSTARIFGSAPGSYGAGGLATSVVTEPDIGREVLGAAYLAATSHAYSAKGDVRSDGFAGQVRSADAYLHINDMAEIDVLAGDAFVDSAGGFAAAAASLGSSPTLYMQDATSPATPKTRTLAEDIARTIRARAANPRWIAGQLRHGHRGAGEIAEAIEAVYGFAVTAEVVSSRQFDLLFDATLGSDAVREALLAANPLACEAIARVFARADARGLWHSRRNSTADILVGMGVGR
jgi:cobaltochelatase CobN